MRISDWSSDVCSSDLLVAEVVDLAAGQGDDDELVGGRLLVAGELLGEAALLVRAQQIGIVDHAAGERRKLERGDGRPGHGESPGGERGQQPDYAGAAKRWQDRKSTRLNSSH